MKKARYVDGFVLVVPKRKIAAYRRMAQKGGKIWMKNGALVYKECVGDDLKVKWGMPFPRLTRLKAGETVIFSWIEYRSRAHRDRVNALVMKDPALGKPGPMPFDMKRMAFGGFKILVDGR